jgi:HEAT repeat protein
MGLRRSEVVEPRLVAVPPSRPEDAREGPGRQHPRDAAGLLLQIQADEPAQRRWAARDLAAHPDTAPALVSRLLSEPERSVRDAIFTSLAAHANAQAAEALLPLLRSETAELRNGAIEALSAMPDAVAPHIDQLLGDADPDVRIFTVNLLGELCHPKVRSWLLQTLRRDAQVNVVAAALEVMAEVGEPQDAAALQEVRARFVDDAFIGFAVDLALQRVTAP